VDLIHLAQDSDGWHVFVNTKINLWLHKMGKFFDLSIM
jgi:hypothetical protein